MTSMSASFLDEFLDKHLLTPSISLPHPFSFRSPSLPDENLNSDIPLPPIDSPVQLSNPAETVFISTAFHAESNLNYGPPDLILHSIPDSIFFYVHRARLIECSTTFFAGLVLPVKLAQAASVAEPLDQTVLSLSESAQVMNTVLHIIYNLSSRHYSPSIEDLYDSLAALAKYGCTIPPLLNAQSEIRAHLLELARSQPLGIYSLGAAFQLNSIAVPASFATLPVSLSSIDQAMAVRMGPVYLRRLYKLHADRKTALKGLMTVAPDSHPDTPTCTIHQRSFIMRAYALIAAYVTWEATPGVDGVWIRSQFAPLITEISCTFCKQKVSQRIASVIEQWAAVPATI